MSKKPRLCADCGEQLTEDRAYVLANVGETVRGAPWLCRDCRLNYTTCSRCGQWTHLRDMRQVWCKSCRSEPVEFSLRCCLRFSFCLGSGALPVSAMRHWQQPRCPLLPGALLPFDRDRVWSTKRSTMA